LLRHGSVPRNEVCSLWKSLSVVEVEATLNRRREAGKPPSPKSCLLAGQQRVFSHTSGRLGANAVLGVFCLRQSLLVVVADAQVSAFFLVSSVFALAL